MNIKQLLIICVLFTLGCTPNVGRKFSTTTIKAQDGMSTVVFYRPHQFLGGLDHRWAINANGEQVSDQRITGIGDNTYAVVKLPSGQYNFYARTGRIDTTEVINLRPATIHYIKAKQVGYSYWTYIVLSEQAETAALEELKELPMQINPEDWAIIYAY
ncbi:MAG: hypothetical protein V3U75_07155 [Methylococcaceae bacterium]